MIKAEEFLAAAQKFVQLSDKLSDGWKLSQDSQDVNKSYIMKQTYIKHDIDEGLLLKAEYVIFYNMSYGVPSFSFNVWDSCGVLLTLEDIRKLTIIGINQKEFYSVITQQEHPIFHRPYFIVHPCHTEELLTSLQNKTRNIIVTFLGLVTPLIKLNLPIEYGSIE